MDKKYISSVRQLTARPRSKRLREQGGTIVGGSSVHVSVEGGASSATDPNSHKHTNLDVLERISTDDQDYICLNQYVEDEETDGFSVKKERAKVGFADMAGALAEEAMKKLMEMLSERYLHKNQPDTAAELITFLKGLYAKGDVIIGAEGYAEGFTGFGTKFGADGSGEMSSLTLRRELRVPSLVFNQTEILVGDKWRAPGAGVIERVLPDCDAEGNLLNTGTFWLKLEKGQIGAVYENAICMGIFHDWENTDNNATEDADDSRGNRTYAGFTTSYFTITEVSNYIDEDGVSWQRKQCRYQIRPISERWSGQSHPYEQMNFVCYGIWSNDAEMLKKYGASVYETRTYRRMLWNQNTWEISAGNIAYQDGDLSNLNIHGMQMEGYSAYLNNIYMTGVIKQFNEAGHEIKVANDRGKWIAGTPYYFYDRVSHKGSLWLCINESGTNTEPTKGDSSWLDEVSSGAGVTAAGHWKSSKVPYSANSIVTFAEKVWISNKETSEPPFGIYTDKGGNRLTYKDGGYVLADNLIQSNDWDLLLDAPQLTNGVDGDSLQVRYSSDKENWHDTFQANDVWMQQRVGDSATWSDPIRIVGEAGAAGADGVYTDYQFAVNDSLEVAPTTGWQDTPPVVGIGQYLWMRMRVVDPNTGIENPWSAARIGGEKGRGVENVTEYYAVSESNTTPPTKWVKDEMPELTESLKYLWNYEEVVYSGDEKVTTNPIVIGMYSKDGNGIVSVTEYYGLSNDPNVEPTGWYTEMLIPTQEVRYLWNKVVTEYSQSKSDAHIRICAVHGDKGDSITTNGDFKTTLVVPLLGIVTMGGASWIAKVATNNPPLWCWTDKDGNRLTFKDGGYLLTGEKNTSEYDLMIQSPKDGKDGTSHEYIYIHSIDRPSQPISIQQDDYIPSGWADDPRGVSESLPIEWVSKRVKTDGVWGEFSTPSIWAKWGVDGENAVYADIDNEMDNVALDSEGKTTSETTIRTKVSMYYGSQVQELESLSASSVNGVNITNNVATGVITMVVAKGVSLSERSEITITCSATINGVLQARELKFTLSAVKAGANGADAVLYDIVSSVSAITKKKDGSFSTSSVSATRMKTIGSSSSETTDGTLKYSIDGGNEIAVNNHTAIDVANIALRIDFLFYDNSGMLVDKESIPMLADGEDGDGFTLMGNWKTGLTVPMLGVVTMGGGSFAAKDATTNPPLWCWTDKDGNRLVFSATEYILTGEYNKSDYDIIAEIPEKGEKGEDGKDGAKGDKGDQGKQGLQGCIYRQTEWVSGAEYHNDINETFEVRYIDIVTVTDSSGNFSVYQCKTSHTSSSSNKPSNSTYWVEMNNMQPVYTPLLVAENAVMRFGQANEILVTGSGNKVTAGISGSDKGDKARFWAGAELPDDAPFIANDQGVVTATKFRTGKKGVRLEANNGLISVFGNLAKNIEFGVNDEGMAVLRYYDNDGTLLYDLGPTGIKNVDRNVNRWVTVRLTGAGTSVDEVFGANWNKVKNPIYTTGTNVYQFLSGFIGGVYTDPASDRRFFKSKSASTTNYIDNGWYVYTIELGGERDTVDGLPSDVNASNPSVNEASTIYVSHLIRLESGEIVESLNAYYNL